ncbi:hypothetical protein DSECCO2_544790 [anaerobic digester metagenome]
MVVQAWLVALFQRGATASEWKKFSNEIEVKVKLAGIGIRTVVGRAVIDEPSGLENLGERLIGDADDRIALAVLQRDIVSGRVLLDQVVFQHQCLILISGYDVLDAGDFRNQGSRFGAPVGKEVAGNPLAQVLGLAHIDDGLLAVPHQVDAAAMR